MGPELSFWTLETSSKGFKTLRIFLDRSRPPQLIFFFTKNDQHLATITNFGEKIRPCEERPAGPEDLGAPRGPKWSQVAPGAPRGPKGPQGAPRGPQGGPQGGPLGSALFPFVGL